MKCIYFMRHGETIDNRNRIIQGQADSALTTEGISSIKEKAKRLNDIAFDAIYCSPLGRTKRSLEILLEELRLSSRVFYSDEIMELDFGTLTKKTIDGVRGIILEHKKDTSKPYPSGESGDMLKERVIRFVDGLVSRKDGSRFLVMTHFGVIETVSHHYVNLPYEDVRLNMDRILFLYFNGNEVTSSWIR